MSSRYYLMFFTLAAFVGAQPPACGAEREVVAVLDAWRARLNRVQSVRYTLTGTNDNREQIPPQVRLPSGSRNRPRSAVVLIDLVNKRCRIESREEMPSKAGDRWTSRVIITTFDGASRYTAVPRDQNEREPDEPDIGISKGNLGQFSFESEFWPAFEAHGIVPTVERPLRPDRLPVEHDMADFVTRGTAIHNSRQCSLLDTVPNAGLRDELWIDLNREGAVSRHTYFNGKNPWIRLDVAFQNSAHGWIPQSWSHTWTSNNKVQNITQFTVAKYEINPLMEESDFKLPVSQGMIVYVDEYPEPGQGLDGARPAKATYRVASDGSLVVIGSKTGFTTSEGVQLQSEDAGVRWWVWVMSVAGICLLLLFLIWWRQRKTFLPAPPQLGGP